MSLIGGHLTRLFDFSGRETRKPFWLCILIVYATQMVLSMVVLVPLSLGVTQSMAALAQYDQSYLDQHPEIATRLITGAMVPFFRNIMIFSGCMGALLLVLVAAAVVRRLHDTNRSGFWGLPVAVIQIATLAAYLLLFPRLFETMAMVRPDAGPEAANAAFASIVPVFALVWLLGFVGFIFMVILIVFLATRGTIGPNRYGDDLLPTPVYYPPQQWQPAPPDYPEPPARLVQGPWSGPPPGG